MKCAGSSEDGLDFQIRDFVVVPLTRSPTLDQDAQLHFELAVPTQTPLPLALASIEGMASSSSSQALIIVFIGASGAMLSLLSICSLIKYRLRNKHTKVEPNFVASSVSVEAAEGGKTSPQVLEQQQVAMTAAVAPPPFQGPVHDAWMSNEALPATSPATLKVDDHEEHPQSAVAQHEARPVAIAEKGEWKKWLRTPKFLPSRMFKSSQPRIHPE